MHRGYPRGLRHEIAATPIWFLGENKLGPRLRPFGESRAKNGATKTPRRKGRPGRYRALNPRHTAELRCRETSFVGGMSRLERPRELAVNVQCMRRTETALFRPSRRYVFAPMRAGDREVQRRTDES